jgi:hypothetical protein
LFLTYLFVHFFIALFYFLDGFGFLVIEDLRDALVQVVQAKRDFESKLLENGLLVQRRSWSHCVG